jgi:phenylalanyl-tRNA synthetase beta chain
MLIPLSLLKEFVQIKLPVEQLAEKLSAAGLTVEKWIKDGDDYVLDPEVTPNRPDWLSVLGVAREIAAITDEKLKYKEIVVPVPKIKNSLPITFKPNYDLVPRETAVIVKDVTVRPSPAWLASNIKKIGLRPINNLVDITNYVLWLYGGLLHVFDYDKIRGHQMIVGQAKGGEAFRSLDGIDYILPKGAVIIKDVGRVIDLLPLKGGENTAASNDTENVLLHSVVVDPVLTRRTSQALGLRSDSSAIAERGLDPNVTIRSVNHALKLILELAGGEIATEVMDHKAADFKPREVSVSHQKIEEILGIKIEPAKVKHIFESLGLTVKGRYSVIIPTFRNDIHIEEDLVEEVGRIIGYNNFPKTLPVGPVPTEKVAYSRDFDLEYEVKQVFKGFGYSEIYTYSLGSEPGIKVQNPISKDYEYLRPNLWVNLLKAVRQNLANFSDIKLYELGKLYSEKEEYWLTAATVGDKFYEVKGEIESLLRQFGVDYEINSDNSNNFFHPGRCAAILTKTGIIGHVGEIHPRFGVKSRVCGFTFNYDLFEKYVNKNKKYDPIPLYPPIVEDITLTLPQKALVGDVLRKIRQVSKLVSTVELVSIHERNYSFRITYLDKTKNLTDKEIAPIGKKIAAMGSGPV